MSSEGDDSGSNTNGTSGGDNHGDANANQRVSQQRPNQQLHRQQRDHHNQHQQQQRRQQQVNSASLGMSSHGAGAGYGGTGLHIASTNAQLHQQLSLLREGAWLGAGQSLSQLGLPFSAYGPIMNNHAFSRGGEGLHQQFFHSNNASARRSQLEEVASESSTNRYQNTTNLMQGQSKASLTHGNMLSSAGTNSSLARNVAMLQHQLNSIGQPMSMLAPGGAPLAAISPEAFAANMQAMNNMGQQFSSYGSTNGRSPNASSNSINASTMHQLRAALSPNPSPFTGVSTRNLGRADGVMNHPESSSVASSDAGNSAAISLGALPQCQGISNDTHEPTRKGAHPLNPKTDCDLPQAQRVNTSTKPAHKSQINPKRHSTPTKVRRQESMKYIERDKSSSTSTVTEKSKLINATKSRSPFKSGVAKVVSARGQVLSREDDSMIQVPTPATAAAPKMSAEETPRRHPANAQQTSSMGGAVGGKVYSNKVTKATTPVKEARVEVKIAPSPVTKAPVSIKTNSVATTSVATDPRNENTAADPTYAIDHSLTSKKVEPKISASASTAIVPSLTAPTALSKTSDESVSTASKAHPSINSMRLTPKVAKVPTGTSKTSDKNVKAADSPAQPEPMKPVAHYSVKNDKHVVKSLPLTAATEEKTSAMEEIRKSQVDDYDPNHPIADLTVAAATNDVLALLQLYGPLTYSQLKFNIATQLETRKQGEPNKHDDLQAVLDTLVELGVIHLVDSSPVASAIISVADDTNVAYCFDQGIPRMDVVLPCELLDKLCDAGDEVSRVRERISLLRTALLEKDDVTHDESLDHSSENATNKNNRSWKRNRSDKDKSQVSTENLLKHISQSYPEIRRDPVYAEAMCMVNVDACSKDLDICLNNQGDATHNDKSEGDVMGKSDRSAKRPSSSSVSPSSGGVKKKRKKGRPPKSSNANTSKSGTDVTFSDRRSSGSPISEVNL
ncbi:hypothetical protein ACHAXS_003476 [Conticribra weissflogii]